VDEEEVDGGPGGNDILVCASLVVRTLARHKNNRQVSELPFTYSY
jgi:hypothetical protein